MHADAAAIIVAAGSSSRMGFDKLLAPLAGKPVLAHTVAAFAACPEVVEIVLVSPPGREATAREAAGDTPLKIVPGGAERQDSVQAGLAATRSQLVAVHDAARPLVTPGAITTVLAAARQHGAATLSRPVTDTLKRATTGGLAGDAVDRTGLHAMETPQCARHDLLAAAYAHVRQHTLHVTDEVSALQAHGTPVTLVPSPHPNPKITFPGDIPLAEALLAAGIA